MKKILIIAAACPAMVLANPVSVGCGCCAVKRPAPVVPASTLSSLDQTLVDLTDVLSAMEGAVKANDAKVAEAQLEKVLKLTTKIKDTDIAERQVCAKAQNKAFQELVSAAWRVEKAAAGNEALRAITSKATQAVSRSFE